MAEIRGWSKILNDTDVVRQVDIRLSIPPTWSKDGEHVVLAVFQIVMRNVCLISVDIIYGSYIRIRMD